ncbi:hypothetical protein [Micromonospora sp. U21]|uniref:hypothetical protein n=1 Tax=Micromonospora sp. U21 TaxID=2824899 RepID=UPI001B38CE94|nr:hypothetical protein [Micromonospora sp. U21]MBQ0901969.1 hypothetical protein [Micromonospora sp. U21]
MGAVSIVLVVVLPVVLWFAFVLAWLEPDLTHPGSCDPEFGRCRPAHSRLLWLALSSAGLLALLCLGAALARLRRGGRWWPWPTAAIACLAGGFAVLSQWPPP